MCKPDDASEFDYLLLDIGRQLYYCDLYQKGDYFYSFWARANEDVSKGEKFVIAVKLDFTNALLLKTVGLARIGNLKMSSLGRFITAMNTTGVAARNILAVLPSLEDPKYIFPYSDSSSYIFLINGYLFPRRYSLPLLQRLLFRVYSLLLYFCHRVAILHRCVYIYCVKL